jgi:dTDP-4-dehydrorhamnose 3,5-epimerase
MDTLPTPLPGALILQPKCFWDARGFFRETYNKRCLEEAGLTMNFIQDNLSYSKAKFTVRGLHFQSPPHEQAKLVSTARGKVLDVIVDLRRSSEKFGQHFKVTLDAEEGRQLYVPPGFAHGFITLQPETVLAYKVSAYYAPDHENGLRFDDPTLGIDWLVDSDDIISSERDQHLPLFDPRSEYFR